MLVPSGVATYLPEVVLDSRVEEGLCSGNYVRNMRQNMTVCKVADINLTAPYAGRDGCQIYLEFPCRAA